MPDKQALLETAKQVLLDIERRFIHMGRVLIDIHNSQAWDIAYESFDNPAKHNFVEELGLTKTVANKLMNINIKLGTVAEAKLLEAGQSRLFELLPYVGKESPERLVDMALAYPNQVELRKGLQSEYGAPKPLCNHEKTYSLTCCNDCGDKWKSYDDSVPGTSRTR